MQCFVQCLYHKSEIVSTLLFLFYFRSNAKFTLHELSFSQVDDRGLIRVDFVIRSLLKHIYSSNTNSETENAENELVRLGKDIIFICYHSTVSSEKLCGASVAAVECLEAVVSVGYYYIIMWKFGYTLNSRKKKMNFEFLDT